MIKYLTVTLFLFVSITSLAQGLPVAASGAHLASISNLKLESGHVITIASLITAYMAN